MISGSASMWPPHGKELFIRVTARAQCILSNRILLTTQFCFRAGQVPVHCLYVTFQYDIYVLQTKKRANPIPLSRCLPISLFDGFFVFFFLLFFFLQCMHSEPLIIARVVEVQMCFV